MFHHLPVSGELAFLLLQQGFGRRGGWGPERRGPPPWIACCQGRGSSAETESQCDRGSAPVCSSKCDLNTIATLLQTVSYYIPVIIAFGQSVEKGLD